MMGMQQPSEPKADGGRATSVLQALGIGWDVSKSVFDGFNPHPKFASTFPPELMFLDGKECVNNEIPITAGLQELISFAPGFVAEQYDDVEVEWLLKSRGATTGTNSWDKITRAGFLGGRQYNFDIAHTPDDKVYTLAARITGKGDRKTNAIFVADVDLVHDIMFQVWKQQLLDLRIDNVLFVLNCVDSLAGDEQYVELRNRRARHRTLTQLEERKKTFEKQRQDEISKADAAAEKELAAARTRLQTILDDLRKDLEKGNVDISTVQVRIQNATEAENRKLNQREKEIEREKNETVRRVRMDTEQDIRKIEQGIWRWAVLFPPLPAILLGLGVLVSRVVGERKGISSDRLRG